MSGEIDWIPATGTGPGTSLARFWRWLPLAGILALSLVLNLWGVWAQGITNEYYAAAVRSMLADPGVLFFNSLDAAGFVTVDKPPIGLWVQCLSATLFGFSGWSLVLPQALAGVSSVALAYLLVARPFGHPAGLMAAFALATTPIFVAVSRNGTMDGLLIFVLLLALVVALKAARDRSLGSLLIAAVLVGVGFNIKMLQAWIVVPALIGVYLVGARPLPRVRRFIHLGLALIVLVGASLSWAVVVDAVPADQRPYIGGSGDNTVLGLIIDYNGLHRLESDGTTGGGAPAGMMGVPPGGNMPVSGPSAESSGGPPGVADTDPLGPGAGNGTAPFGAADAFPAPPDTANRSTGADGARGPPPANDGANRTADGPVDGGGRGGVMDDAGQPGLLRLLGEGLAGQISWLLPLALIGLVAWMRRPAEPSLRGLAEALGTDRGLVLLGGALWLFPGLAYFSFTTGFWHTYYLATIAPPLAILAGCGVWGLYTAYRSGGARAWLLPIAVAVTGLVGAGILLYTPQWSGAFIPLVLIGSLAVTAALAGLLVRRRTEARFARIAVCVALALLFIGPLAYACTPLAYGNGGILPTVGPTLIRSGGVGDGTRFDDQDRDITGLAAYLVANQGNATYIAATSSSNSGGASLIIATGMPVMILGGFSGSDQIVSTDELAERVRAGEVRYFLVGNGGGPGGSDLLSWVQAHGTRVDASEWGGVGQGYTLYDCGGLGSA